MPDLRDVRRDDCLLAAVGDFMYDLEQYHQRAYLSAIRTLRWLFGFPMVPRWTERPISTEARQMALSYEMDVYLRHYVSLPDESRAVYDRAEKRIRCHFKRQSSECAAVWVPIYEHLVHHHMPESRKHPDLHARRCLTGPAARP